MDRSIHRLPDPIAAASSAASGKERRRCIRQKLHTPVYASFNGPETGMVVDLSELLDLHEDGFAVRTSERLEMNRAVTVCLDLPETKNYIHGNGEVIWSDDAGRSGIRFSALTDHSRRILKEWLFANLLIACSNQAARAQQIAYHEDENRDRNASADLLLPKLSNVVPISDRTSDKSLDKSAFADSAALSVNAFQREVRELGSDVETVLRLVTERAMFETNASGAVLAFLTDDGANDSANSKMVCRARAGKIAPPLGAQLSTSEGLSGECVRTGRLVYCEDLQNDPRVDPAIGRELGIGSLLAAPIVADLRVVGLLEVFSPEANAFTLDHGTMLQRIVETISNAPVADAPVAGGLADVRSLGSIHEALSFVTQETPQVREQHHGLQQNQELDARDSASPVAATETSAPRELAVPVPDQSRESVERGSSDAASSTTSRLVYRALLGLVVAVVAMVVGYIVGPAVASGMKKAADSSKSLRTERGRPTGEVILARTPPGQTNSHAARTTSLTELRKVADQGDADGQWQMGVRYHNGEDVRQDDSEAMRWFQRAAEQGNVAAQSALGSYYWAGRGVPQDMSKAYFWSVIALAQGDDNSKGRLEGLASQMTRAQVSAARQQAEAWIRSHSENAKSVAN